MRYHRRAERLRNLLGRREMIGMRVGVDHIENAQAFARGDRLVAIDLAHLGIDQNRLCLLTAILEKRAGYRLYDQDVYVNIAGGLRILEPAVDLGVVAALISSEEGKTISPQSIFFGEVGLGGEVRSVPRASIRLKEAQRIGLKTAYLPGKAAKEMKKEFSGMEMIPIDHIRDLPDKL